MPTQCFPDGIVYGIVYGIVEDRRIVSVANAHRTGLIEDREVDLAVETAPPYRNRGYAKTVVSAVTAHMTSTGGEAVSFCRADNLASMTTAKSVGYVLYGKMVVVIARL